MEKIVKTYGKTFFEVAVIILLVLLIFTQVTDVNGNRGILQMIGANIVSTDSNYREYADFDIFEADAAKAKPVITYMGSNTMRVGEHCLTNYIQAISYAGTSLPVKIVQVVDWDGMEVTFDANACVVFEKPGIYTVTVRAVDEIKKEIVTAVQIPVNQ